MSVRDRFIEWDATPPALRSTAPGRIALACGIAALALGIVCVAVLVLREPALHTPVFVAGAVVGAPAVALGMFSSATHRGQVPGAIGVLLAGVGLVVAALPVLLVRALMWGTSAIIGL